MTATEQHHKRVTLTMKDRYTLIQFMEPLVEKLPDGQMRYKDGLTDVRVAQMFKGRYNVPVTPAGVRSVREAIFGKSIAAGATKSLREQVADLDARLTALETGLGVNRPATGK